MENLKKKIVKYNRIYLDYLFWKTPLKDYIY